MPALAAGVPDVLAADGFVLGTPANIGYMSGALKHFFDQVYYPCLLAKAGAPYGLYVHGGSDTTGAVRAVQSIATGLSWREAVRPVRADRAGRRGRRARVLRARRDRRRQPDRPLTRARSRRPGR